jgi:pimeloyl-ACP methyl ester carboxylesterase
MLPSRAVMSMVCAASIVASCGGRDGSGADTTPAPPPPAADRCSVSLHGKGGDGTSTFLDEANGIAYIRPTGNAEGWGARQWRYDDGEQYLQARAVVASAIDASGCTEVIIGGFSNGGAFAARLACRGETFDGRVIGYVVDDPVPDGSTDGCTPPAGVALVLYWTGDLAETATPGWDCGEGDWTCLGGTTVGIEAFAEGLGVPITPSPFDEHTPFSDAPELTAFD